MNAVLWFNANRRAVQIAVSFVAMLCLLAYTWLHTGNLLGRYITPGVLGYVAAFGIELAVVAMAFRIGELGWTAPNATPFKWTLAGVLGVSVLANLAEGYATRYTGDLVVDAVGRLDPIQGIIGVAATALLSIVVYALAEIVGSDVRTVQQAERPSSELNDSVQPASNEVDGLDAGPNVTIYGGDLWGTTWTPADVNASDFGVQPPSSDVYVDPLLSFLASNPDASYSAIGQALNVSKSTASNRVKALMDAGVVSRNGHGWELHA